MNIYKLNNKELKKLHDEFNKTAYGKRIKLFSTLPFIIGFLFMIGSILASACIDVNDIAGTSELALIFDCLLFFNVIFGCITQLQYGNALKEYANYKNI